MKYYRLINKKILNDINPLINLIEIGIIKPDNEIPINIQDIVMQLYVDCGKKSENEVKQEFSKFVSNKFLDNFDYQEYFRLHVAKYIVNAEDEVKNMIEQVIKQHIAEGKTINDSVKLIRLIKNISKKRALVIARTETIAANNFGSLQGAEAAGVNYNKMWLTIVDGKTRDSHRSMNRKQVPKDGIFEVEGDSMRFPGDKSKGASAKNVVNCRCQIGYKIIRK